MMRAELGCAHTTIVGGRTGKKAAEIVARHPMVERDRKNIISNEIQNIDATMTEEDIEYIRQMLEEDREILVKLS